MVRKILSRIPFEAVAGFVAIMLLLSAVGGAMAWQPVDEGNVKVVKDYGEYKTTLTPGANFVNPISDDVRTYSTRDQLYVMSSTSNEGQKTGDDSIKALAKDQQKVFVDVGVRWRLDPKETESFISQYSGLRDVEGDLIRDIVRGTVRTEVGGRTTDKVNTEKAQIEMAEALEAKLNNETSDAGIIIESVTIRNVRFSASYQQAVEDKKKAQQRVEEAKAEAEQRRVDAEGKADAKLIEAEADAEAELIRAEAKAQANEKIRRSINEELVNYRFVEKLDDTDNVYFMGGEGGNTPLLTKDVDEDDE